MDPIRFDQFAKTLARRRSRRHAVVQLGSAALAGVLGIGRGPGASLAQTVTPATTTPGARPVFPPIPVSQTFAPLFPAPDLDPVVGFDEEEIIPILGPPVGVEQQPEFVLPEEFPDVVAVTDGEVVPLIDFIDFDPDVISAPPSTPAADAAAATTEEAACGIVDSHDVERYPGSPEVPREFVAAHWPPVGNIQWNWKLNVPAGEEGNVAGLRWCSGTLIDDIHFLTASHCFRPNFGGWDTPTVNGAPIDRRESARNMRVNFNYQWGPNGEQRPETSVAIVELVEDRLGDLDYTIVRLERNPGPPFLPAARIAAKDAPQGSVLCMMGHPSMLPKRVANGHASQYQGPLCYYDDLDTAGGASGAGLLSPATGLLVGIHTNGGCDVATGNNHGLRIEALLEVSPLLRSLAGR
jgi:V8-like Glu-specific endopeptidase